MQNSLQQKIELFVKNTQNTKREFRWQSELIKRVSALLYVSEDKEIDVWAINKNMRLIKNHTGRLSPFRKNALLIVATMLSLNDEPEKLFDRTLEVYELLRSNQFRSSDFLAVAACQVALNRSPDHYLHVVERTKLFYQHMKNNHKFLTGDNDYIFAALLGLSDIEINSAVERMEQLYTSLQPRFRSRYGVKSLSQILVLSEFQETIENRVTTLYDDFIQSGLKVEKSSALSSLGVLALLPAETDAIMDQVIETAELLRSKKGFGFWSSVSKRELSLLATNLVALHSLKSIEPSVVDTTLSTSVLTIVIAQQTATMTAAISSTIASQSINQT